MTGQYFYKCRSIKPSPEAKDRSPDYVGKLKLRRHTSNSLGRELLEVSELSLSK